MLLSVYDDVSAIYGLQWIISIITVCYVVNRKNTNPAYKLVWSILIMSVPLFGVFMYLFLHVQFGTMKFNNKKNRLISLTKPLMPQDKQVMRELEEDSVYMAHLAQYVNNFGRYPVYKNTQIDYYKIGEEKYESLIRELQKAKKFIFMEYFIIDLGEVWNTILKILEQKVDEGVEVRLLYDGMGSQLILPQYYNTYLETKGIKCRVFNEYRPFLSTLQNNRDHRKIVVIDGKVAFNGGVNLADEYINEVSRFGHWKDTAVMIKGDAVRSYTVMFIQMWERKTRQLSEYERYKTKYLDVPEKGEIRADGFVMPYGDSPTRNEYIAK
ncbi:MAG: PLDc N-terminal domain-containing protein, partial [Oscillospiraceae bacterium]|nr:PLDc N-terminal domain-containing protein [Oscillospiraceae bacterium]